MTIATGERMYASDINNLTFFPIGTILQFSGGEYTRLTSARTADNKAIWTLCNGTAVNGITVPNLVDKFLRGAASSGTTAGADSQEVTLQTANLPSHNHEATGLSLGSLSTSGLMITQSGGHTHTGSGSTNTTGAHAHSYNTLQHIANPALYSTADLLLDDACNRWKTVAAATSSGEGGHAHTVSVSIPESGSHSHTISGSISGGSVTGSTANTGSGTPLAINTLPSYYTVVYIMKVA
jgi:hypothetical protein